MSRTTNAARHSTFDKKQIRCTMYSCALNFASLEFFSFHLLSLLFSRALLLTQRREFLVCHYPALQSFWLTSRLSVVANRKGFGHVQFSPKPFSVINMQRSLQAINPSFFPCSLSSS